MHDKDWYGSVPPSVDVFPTATAETSPDMTAIAVAYSHGRFVTAADGRSATNGEPFVIESDRQQKIFNEAFRHVSLTYGMSGLAHTRDNSFATIAEAHEQVKALIKRPFRNGYELASKFCSNMERVVEKAITGRRLEPFKTLPNSITGDQRFLFVFLLFGYFKSTPFLRVAQFHCDTPSQRIYSTAQDPNLQYFQFAAAGSDVIRKMFYGQSAFDPRLSDHKYVLSSQSDALAATTSYVKACTLPAAVEIDPWCRGIGGRIHIAEHSQREFKWLIPPLC